MTNNVDAVIINALKEASGRDVSPEQRIYHDLGIDSLTSIDVIMTIEERLGITLEQLSGDATVRDLIKQAKDIKDEAEHKKLPQD